MNINITLHLVPSGMAGEETVSNENLCWVTKTHWPLEPPLGGIKFPAQKCISIARNPIDIIPSLGLLINTTSQSLMSEVPLNELEPTWWAKFAQSIMKMVEENTLAMRQ